MKNLRSLGDLAALTRRERVVIDNGRGIVFKLETDDLPNGLSFRADPYDESHGFIEPAYPMKFKAYQRTVGETSDLWRPVKRYVMIQASSEEVRRCSP